MLFNGSDHPSPATPHLPPLTGTKYKYARQWKIYCVTPQWFYDSIQTGYCQAEGDYDVDTPPEGREEEPPVRRGRGPGEEGEVPEWSRRLAEFTVPSEAASCFLDGCKVRKTPSISKVQ